MRIKFNILDKNKISLSPSIKAKDLLISFLDFIFKDQRNSYRNLYKSENCLAVSRSTLSLSIVCEYLKFFKNKKTIFIPDYICNESLSILRKNDTKIFFYDHSSIDKKELILKLQQYKADIFLYVNYFGKKNNITKDLLSFIKKNEITIIEDNAHCINSLNNNHSEIELYSPHKLFGLENGGIIKFKEKKEYKNFKNFFYKKNAINKFSIFFKFFDLILFLTKKKLRNIFGYKYPKLDFNKVPKTKLKISKQNIFLSSMLLDLYSKRADLYKRKRRLNYEIWKESFNYFLPFLKMERIDYVPYLGIIKFSNNKERTQILQKYNSYGLPIGNWPDLPPEVIKSKNIHKKAFSKFKNQITIPVHQDINSNQIKYCIKKCFKMYVNSFTIYYSHVNKEIKIRDKNNLIGSIFILYNNQTKLNMLSIKFHKNFYDTFNESADFLYKFSREIIEKYERKINFHIPKDIVFSKTSKLASKGIYAKNIIPLNIKNKKILDFINIFLDSTFIDKNKKIEITKQLKINSFNKLKNTEKLSTYILKNKKNNKLVSIMNIKIYNNFYILKNIEVFDDSFDLSIQLMSLCLCFKRKGYDFFKIETNFLSDLKK